MAAMFMVKNLQEIIFSRTNRHMTLKPGKGLRPIIVCSNDYLKMTLTYFMARLNLVSYVFICKHYLLVCMQCNFRPMCTRSKKGIYTFFQSNVYPDKMSLQIIYTDTKLGTSC